MKEDLNEFMEDVSHKQAGKPFSNSSLEELMVII